MSIQPASSPGQSVSGPNWSTVTEEILCPLCDYNLRGLIEPRCPECGYKFAWPELIDPSSRLHPYLFEHHPERRAWSFWRTLTAGLHTRRFWKALHPAQPSLPGRLVLYWFLAFLPMLLTIPANLGGMAIAIRRENLVRRASESAVLNSPRYSELLASTVQDYGSLDNYLNKYYPVDWPSVIRVVGDYRDNLVMMSTPAGILLVWPWLTAFGLLLFQISMRRARVRRAHVLRCICYSIDVSAWVGLAIVPAMLIYASLPSTTTPRIFWGMAHLELLACAGAILVFGYRLLIAYRRYIRFPRSFWVILAAQLIALLLLANLFVLTIVLIEQS